MITKATYRFVRTAAIFAFFVMLANNTVAVPASQHVTVTGWIGCTHYFMPNACKAQSRVSCIQSWVSQGDPYILVVGNHRYKLSGDENELAKAVAENSVTITGNLDGNELAVESVEWKGKQPGHE
jgi:hypothetical protein